LVPQEHPAILAADHEFSKHVHRRGCGLRAPSRGKVLSLLGWLSIDSRSRSVYSRMGWEVVDGDEGYNDEI
jgi:hypothetical protein